MAGILTPPPGVPRSNDTRGRPARKNARGRPASLSKEMKDELISIYWSQLLSVREIAKRFGVSHMTVWRAVQGTTAPQFP